MKFEKDSIVYVNTYNHVGEKCKVTGHEKQKQSTRVFYHVHSIDGIGSFAVPNDHVFATKEEALEAYRIEVENSVRGYKEEIKTLEDLLKFPLNHCFVGEEYTDYEAVRAYKERVKELTEIDTSDY
jgi:hypothetical protein